MPEECRILVDLQLIWPLGFELLGQVHDQMATNSIGWETLRQGAWGINSAKIVRRFIAKGDCWKLL
jgi:hypothetical protein